MKWLSKILCSNCWPPFARTSRKISSNTDLYIDPWRHGAPFIKLSFSSNNTLRSHNLLLMISILLMVSHQSCEQMLVGLALTSTLHCCTICSQAYGMDSLESYGISTLGNLLGGRVLAASKDKSSEKMRQKGHHGDSPIKNS
jgi:hypothetical protein